MCVDVCVCRWVNEAERTKERQGSEGIFLIDRHIYTYTYLRQKFVVPSKGSIIHVGASSPGLPKGNSFAVSVLDK